MKMKSLLLMSLLLVPAAATGANVTAAKPVPPAAAKAQPAVKLKGGPPAADAQAEAERLAPKVKYLIHLKDGGKVEADNYTREKDGVRVITQSGAITLENAMVGSIEEVTVRDDTPEDVDTKPQPAAQAPPAGATGPKGATRAHEAARPNAVVREKPAPYEPVDDNGHNEEWWKQRVDNLVQKRAEASERYTRAESDWNRYNGILGGSTFTSSTSAGSGSQFDTIRFQDLRGASRAEMDKATAEIEKINKILKYDLPDEARKAGAPPGWTR